MIALNACMMFCLILMLVCCFATAVRLLVCYVRLLVDRKLCDVFHCWSTVGAVLFGLLLVLEYVDVCLCKICIVGAASDCRVRSHV